MNIGKGVIMLRLFEVDRIKNLDSVPIFQKNMTAIDNDISFGISDYI